MKKTKLTIAAGLVIGLALAFTGCNNNPDTETEVTAADNLPEAKGEDPFAGKTFQMYNSVFYYTFGTDKTFTVTYKNKDSEGKTTVIDQYMYKYTYDTEAMTLTTAVYKASLPSNVEEYIKAYLEAGEKSYAYEIANYKYLIAVANGDTTATAPEAYTPSFPETDNYTLVNCTEYKNATIPFYEKLISIHEKQIKALNDLKTTTKDETILGKIKSSIKSAETSLEYSKRSVNEVALLFSNSSTDLYSFEEDGKLTLTKQFSGALKDQTYSFSFSGDNCYLYVGPYPSMVIYSTGSNFSLSNLKIADGIITGNNLSATYTTEGTGNDTVVTLTITDLPEGYEDYKKTYTLKLNSTSQVYVPVTE